MKTAHLLGKKGKKHGAQACWKILIAHAMPYLSPGDASNRLDEMFWDPTNRHRWHKLVLRTFIGARVRREHMCPNSGQVGKYSKSLLYWLVSKLIEGAMATIDKWIPKNEKW